MKKVLVYYPFPLAKEANSGSKLRPLEMLKAFHTWGEQNNVEILVLSGTTAEREKQFTELKAGGQLNDVWFCYMENQTIPIWLTDPGHKPAKPFIDRKVLKFLQAKKVPVGVFYRDIYWKFDELYPLKGLKKKVMQTVYRFEEKFYQKYCNVIFVPSLEMGRYVEINRQMVDLPPGGKKVDFPPKTAHEKPFEGIYVGAIKSEEYGLALLLDALEIVNVNELYCRLTVVCRPDEYASLPQTQKDKMSRLQVEVKHISGAALDELYKGMDFAFIPRLCSEYQHFSMPVKLVEYLSNGLPIVATECEAQKRFINEDGYGVVCKDEKQSMADAIEEMGETLAAYQENIAATFLKNHSWVARVEKVKNSLVGE